MVGSIEVFIGVGKKVTIVKKVTDRNLKGYRLFIYRLSAVTKKKKDLVTFTHLLLTSTSFLSV